MTAVQADGPKSRARERKGGESVQRSDVSSRGQLVSPVTRSERKGSRLGGKRDDKTFFRGAGWRRRDDRNLTCTFLLLFFFFQMKYTCDCDKLSN